MSDAIAVHSLPRGAERRPRAPLDGVYAALDLGTNNCRMLVARPHGRGFRVIDAFSRITRLGEGLTASGALSAAAMGRTVDALAACAEKMVRRGVTRARHVATEACRQATNCDHFLSRVAAETGIEIEIITAEEEAGLALAGCAALLDRRLSDALVFDIGGGSTELMWVRVERGRPPRIEAFTSLPIGVVSLAEQRAGDLGGIAGYRRVLGELTARFAPFEERCRLRRSIRAHSLQVLGTSGTVTTLGGVHLGLPRYERAAVDGLLMPFHAIHAVSRRLAAMDHAERAAQPCVGPERADLVVAGCVILEAICNLWPVGRLRVADRGLREGMLLGMIRADAFSPHALASAAE